MEWLHEAGARPSRLPAIWLLATAERPRDLPQRSQLRRRNAASLIAQFLDRGEDEIAIGHEPSGRPFLSRPAGTGLHLSLATRGGVVAVALASRPVGVDVELVTTAEIPWAVLHPDESRALQELALPEQPLAFARLWCLKEAYLKAVGTGLTRPPESFRVRLAGGAAASVDDPLGPGASRCEAVTSKGSGGEMLAAACVVLD